VKRLLHISDCHLFADRSRAGYAGITPYTSLQQVFAQSFSASSPDIDAVLVTGDISGDDSVLSYQHFETLVTQYVDKPLFVIGGNHDNNPHFDRQLASYLLHAGKSMELGCWHIHALDTRFKGTRGKIDECQLARIQQDIEKTKVIKDRFHLLAMHHHLLPSNSWMDNHDVINPDVLLAWLTTDSGVKGIIHGHVHAPLRRKVPGDNAIEVIGVPASCWQWEMTEDFAVSNLEPGYQIVSLHNDGTMSCDVRRIRPL